MAKWKCKKCGGDAAIRLGHMGKYMGVPNL